MQHLRIIKKELLEYYRKTGDRNVRAEMRKIDKQIKKKLESAETEEEAEEIALQRASEESACDSCCYDNETEECEF